MKNRRALGVGVVGLACLLVTAALQADTLVMKDGRRVEGELISIRDGVIEFMGQRGFFGPRERMRIDRADVRRIELDDIDRDRLERERLDRERLDRERADRDREDRRDERPAGMRERTVSVESTVPWSDTGVEVRSGQTVYFSATGRVRWGPGRQDSPEGERNSPYNAGRPIPNRPAAALIGRIGESNDYFFIGDDKSAVRMRASGRLYLGINDDFLRDNSGAFRVVVYY